MGEHENPELWQVAAVLVAVATYSLEVIQVAVLLSS